MIQIYDPSHFSVGKIVGKKECITFCEPGYTILRGYDKNFDIIKTNCDLEKLEKFGLTLYVSQLKSLSSYFTTEEKKEFCTDQTIEQVFSRLNENKAKTLQKRK